MLHFRPQPRSPKPVSNSEQGVRHQKYVEKAERVRSVKRLSMDSFSDLYGSATVLKDQELLDLTRKRYHHLGNEKEKRAKEQADVFEAFILDAIDHGLFGRHGKALATSEYDDVIGGVDAIAEIAKEAGVEQLGLALDATFGSHAPNVDKKFSNIVSSIYAGRLAYVKYFQSEASGHCGEYRVPLFVVGFSYENMLPLLSSWVDGRDDILARSPFPLVLLKQIEEQSDTFATISDAHGHNSIAGRYRRIRSLIESIRQAKRNDLAVPVLPPQWKDDRVVAAISNARERLLQRRA